MTAEPFVSDYVTVDQQRIDAFAAATDDRQWIHCDPERAAASPFGRTIAHGFLTLALLPKLLGGLLRDAGGSYRVNYGLTDVRFISPVPAGSAVRARATLVRETDIRNGIERTWDVLVECTGSRLPACVAVWTVRYYPCARSV